ncbi:MAG TPA: hypothetical protein VEX38_02255, partial [Fimbriimonadaceae bacterium]|nr:hypothetical protein [Fimbriimonadaceae bacterium]
VPDGQGGVYVTRSSEDSNANEDMVTLKFDAAGNQVWAKRFQGPENGSDVPSEIALDPAGNIVVTGFVHDLSSNPPAEPTTIKYDPNGNLLWARRLATQTSWTKKLHLAVDRFGNTYTGFAIPDGTPTSPQGFVVTRYDSAGNLVWSRKHELEFGYDLAALELGPDGSIHLFGQVGDRSVVLRYNSAFQLLWSRFVSPTANWYVQANDLSVSPSGEVTTTAFHTDGNFRGDVLTKRYSNSGQELFSSALPGTIYTHHPGRVALAGLDTVYIGFSAVATAEDWDFHVAKYEIAGLAELSAPQSVVGGNEGIGSVRLSYPSTSAVNVSLSSNSTAIRVPSPVLVPAGQTAASFRFSTTVVTSATTRTITATLNGRAHTANVTVTPGGLVGLSVNPANLTATASTTGTVTLSGPASSGGAQVALSSNSPVIGVPASITVPQGQTSAQFTITTSYVSARVTRTVTAAMGSATRQANITIAPAYDLVVNPSTVLAGNSTTARVTIPNAAPSGGQVIAVSTNSSALVVPSSVTIPPGEFNVLFTIGTRPVSASTGRYVTVTYNGVNKSALVTIEPSTILMSLSVTPSTVKGGQN